MQCVNSYARMAFCGVVLGAAALMGACQQTGHQSSAEGQAASSNTASPSTGTGVTSPQVIAYVPGAMQVKPIQNCNLEGAGKVEFGAQPVSLKASEKSGFAGWIDASGLAQPTYWLRFDNQPASHHFQMPVTLTVQRPDVASTHPGAPLVSGFDVDLPADSLPVGEYHVYLAASADGQTYACDNGRHVDVTP